MELGAGVGLVGLALAAMGARVTITDVAKVSCDATTARATCTPAGWVASRLPVCPGGCLLCTMRFALDGWVGRHCTWLAAFETLPSSSRLQPFFPCLRCQVLPLMQANLEANGYDPAKG